MFVRFLNNSSFLTIQMMSSGLYEKNIKKNKIIIEKIINLYDF